MLDGTALRLSLSYSLASSTLVTPLGEGVSVDLTDLRSLPFWIRRLAGLGGHQRTRSPALFARPVYALVTQSTYTFTTGNTTTTTTTSYTSASATSGVSVSVVPHWRQQRVFSVDTNQQLLRVCTEEGGHVALLDLAAAGIQWPSAGCALVVPVSTDATGILRVYISEVLGMYKIDLIHAQITSQPVIYVFHSIYLFTF
jgi:hypothetical protein